MATYSREGFLSLLWYWIAAVMIVVVVTIFLSSRDSDTTPRTVYRLDGVYRTNEEGSLEEVRPMIPEAAIGGGAKMTRRRASS